jgi:predicted esterase
MKQILLFLFLCCLSANIKAQTCLPANGRFARQVFPTISITKNITFGTADRYDAFNINNPQPIKLDFYTPQNDTMQKRPLVLVFFGGGFTLGDKSDADVTAWADSLAHYGYATASVNYRLGLNTLSQGSAVRAVCRAVQDARAAVRFFKENHLLYKIDTTRIFLAGESAGAITALHTAYIQNDSQVPTEAHGISGESQDLGCLDCAGNTFQHTVDIKGVISLWGAVYKLNYLQQNLKIPTLLIHGTNDAIVKYDTGRPFSSPTFPTLYGSLPVHNRMDSLGIYNQFFPYQGQGHLIYGIPTITVTFPNQYWNPIFQQGATFLYNVMQQLCSTTATENGKNNENRLDATVFPNPTTSLIHIKMNSLSANTQARITDMQGKIVFIKNNISTDDTLNMEHLPKGVYFILLENNEGVFRTKIVKI